MVLSSLDYGLQGFALFFTQITLQGVIPLPEPQLSAHVTPSIPLPHLGPNVRKYHAG